MSITEVVASTLGIPVHRVTDELSYNSIREWDSLSHVNLMLALEKILDIEIDEDMMVELTTVKAIRALAEAKQDG
jgi:citrate synthase